MVAVWNKTKISTLDYEARKGVKEGKGKMEQNIKYTW